MDKPLFATAILLALALSASAHHGGFHPPCYYLQNCYSQASAQPATYHAPAPYPYLQPSRPAQPVQQIIINNYITVNVNAPAGSYARPSTYSPPSYSASTRDYSYSTQYAAYSSSYATTGNYPRWLGKPNVWYQMPDDESAFLGQPRPNTSPTFPPYFQSSFGQDAGYYQKNY